MDPSTTQYVYRDAQAVAYQVVGEGPSDVVWFLEINNHLDLLWTDPHIHHLLERGASYARTAYFQRRGVGLSGSIDYVPTIEQQSDDVLAIMDAVGMKSATLVGIFGTCGPLSLVAARAPERVNGLVLINPIAQGPLTTAEPLRGWDDSAALERFVAGYRDAFDHWGSGATVAMWDFSLGSPYNRRLMGMLERCSATPATAHAYFESILRLDISEVLGAVQSPTRVLRVPSSPVAEGAVQHVATLIRGATYHSLPPTPAGASIGEAFLPIFDHIELVATGTRRSIDADRFLGSVLFTDVVCSTEILATVGDAQYQEMRARHEREVRAEVERMGGRLINVVGDGTFSVFDGPSRAVRCARTICEAGEDLGMPVRAGVHTGELDRSGPEPTGMTVHIGARICAAASAGEVLMSSTVRDLVGGSGSCFAHHGMHELKGVPGKWELYSVVSAEGTSNGLDHTRLRSLTDRAALHAARRSPRLARAAVQIGNAWQRLRTRRKQRRGT